MEHSIVTVYGTTWCSDCVRSKTFLGERGIEYEWIDIDTQPDLQDYVKRLNNGTQIVPTIVFPDGSFLSEPSNSVLAEKLGISQ